VPRDPESPQPSFLGGEFEVTARGARITRIYRSDPELPNDRAPLALPGVSLRVGDVIVAVNGRAVTGEADLTRALSHQAGEQVRLDYTRDGVEGSVVTRPVSGGRQRRAALQRLGDGPA
jgi:tricorn protease